MVALLSFQRHHGFAGLKPLFWLVLGLIQLPVPGWCGGGGQLLLSSNQSAGPPSLVVHIVPRVSQRPRQAGDVINKETVEEERQQ